MFERKKGTKESRIIDKLIKENQELRDQIESLNPDAIRVAEEAHDEYTALIAELKMLQIQYKQLLKDMEKEKKALLKACK